jgi:hypothetical protein
MTPTAWRTIPAVLLLAVTMLLTGITDASAARRAFVVGNSAYTSAPPLPNPANDARDLGQRLERLGYDVTLGLDLGRAQLLQRFQTFAGKLEPDDIALVYFAGHGLQIGGENYLFPVDANVDSEADARQRLVPLNAMISDLSRVTRTRIVILDACRNNPFGEKLTRSAATRSAGVAQGLARVYAGVGSFIAYSTQPGNVALDGQGRNSPFTEALLKHMATPGADVHAVMRRVRADVQKATSEQQVPWENSSLVDEMAFAANTAGATSGGTATGPAGHLQAARPPATRPPVSQQTSRQQAPLATFSYVTGLDPSGDNFLALRTRPSTSEGSRMATMGPDTLLTVLESRGPWRRVELPDGISGWAHGNWIACCRTFAGAAAAAPSSVRPPPVAQPASDTCESLWYRRNAIWHRAGYCFTGLKGRQTFGNASCSRDQTAARAAMPPADRAEVDALHARERDLGCH